VLDGGDDLGERQRCLAQTRALADLLDRHAAAHGWDQGQLGVLGNRLILAGKLVIDRDATMPERVGELGVGVGEVATQLRDGGWIGPVRELDLEVGHAKPRSDAREQQDT
jgi:hypothetical protein